MERYKYINWLLENYHTGLFLFFDFPSLNEKFHMRFPGSTVFFCSEPDMTMRPKFITIVCCRVVVHL